MRRTAVLLAAPAAAGALVLTVACGSSGGPAASAATTGPSTARAPSPTSTVGDVESEPTTTLATTAPAGAAKVAIVMGRPEEFSMAATPARVPAGMVTFGVVNRGTILHEMVIVPGRDAAALRQADGTASEKGSPGEVPDVRPGASGKVTLTLPAGRYVVLCNLPGHFAGGMYTTLVVG